MGTVIGIIVGAVVVGVIIGALARLVIPGKQDISLVMTIAIGFAGALAGGAVAEVLGVRETAGFDWIKTAFQIGFAALGVIGYERFRSSRSSQPAPEEGQIQ